MLYFYNDGEIDIRGATIAGLSAKESSSAIGFFGTGLKYAISCINRWGGKISIWSGETLYQFGTEEIGFRDKKYTQLTIQKGDEEPSALGFTTDYGKKWEPWQVFRELYSNALDEGGGVSSTAMAPAAGKTLIVVDCIDLDAPYKDRNNIILPKNASYAFICEEGGIINTPATDIFYRGVKVYPHSCALTYNVFDKFELTEDRTLKYNFYAMNEVGKILMKCDRSDIIMTALGAPDDAFEHKATYYAHYPFSKEFLECAVIMYKKNPARFSYLASFLQAHSPETIAPKEIELSPMRQKMLNKSINLAKTMGFPQPFPKIIVADLGQQTLGKFDLVESLIIIDPKTFDQGTKQVLSTLYEELTHWHYGHPDNTYEMQTHLFNTIISLYEEHVIGEPV